MPAPSGNHFLAQLNKQKEQKEQKRSTAQKPSDPQRPLRKTQDKQHTSTGTVTSKDKAQALVKNLLGGPGKGLASLFGSAGKGNELAMNSRMPSAT